MDMIKTNTPAGIACAMLLGAAALLTGCANHVDGPDNGGGGGGGAMGPVTVAITDLASNDIESCWVEITSIKLRRLNGVDVTVLSAPVQVDLASLEDLSQILTTASVPAGLYTQATLTIDFFGAACFLVGNSAPATILDSTGTPVTGIVQVPLQLDSPLAVSTTTHKLLELDFDLDQSFTVDLPGNTVTLEPVFVLHVDPTAPKQLIASGTLTGVNPGTSTFTGDILSTGGLPAASVTFHATPTTIFQVDGVPSTGTTGLTALILLGAGASIECFGTLSPTSNRVEVAFCQAGSGTFDGGTGIVQGHIVGRSGGVGADAVLQVLGHSIDSTHSAFTYATTFQVNTSFASTKVVKFGSSAVLDTDELNIGQRVRVFGTLTGTTMDATAMDNVVRLERTRVFGVAAGAPLGTTLTMDLTSVGPLPQGAFTWSEGGPTPPTPSTFHVDVGSLGAGLNIVSGTHVIARGFFTATDDVNQDFKASSLANADSAASLMLVHNEPAVGFTVLVSTSPTLIQITVSGAAAANELAIVDHGLLGSIPLPASPTPNMVRPSMTGFYSLRDRGTNAIQVFTHFSDFSSALGSAIAQGATVIQISGLGTYTSGTNSIDAAVGTAVIE
jgi:hypothetical protein